MAAGAALKNLGPCLAEVQCGSDSKHLVLPSLIFEYPLRFPFGKAAAQTKKPGAMAGLRDAAVSRIYFFCSA